MMNRQLQLLVILLLAAPAGAQSLSGAWQGVETAPDEKGRYWPVELRLQQNKVGELFGVLYQEVGDGPEVSVTFRVAGTRTKGGLELEHESKLAETGRSPFSYWCAGAITFTYDPAQEKLTGHATYRPVGDCTTGDFTLYRVKRKSAATVPAGAATTLRVSGRDVRWYADATATEAVAVGNTYRTRLRQTTTFYLAQGYYPTQQSDLVPVTFRVAETPPAAPAPAPAPPPAPADPAPQDTASAAPPPAPVVLPTVLFKLATPELLPTAYPALDQLAAELRARPALRIQVAGHTDRIGEPQKNLLLSEQRAEAVKAYLVKTGVEAARIRTIGYGDARPLYPSPDARNRRVEVGRDGEIVKW